MTTENPDGDDVELVRATDERDESSLVAGKILALKEAGCDFCDIAVLARCHHQMPAVESALVLAGIPYAIPGGMTLFDRPEVKKALSTATLLGKGEMPPDLDRKKLKSICLIYLGEKKVQPKKWEPAKLIYLARIIQGKSNAKIADPEERTLNEAYLSSLERMAVGFSAFDEFVEHLERARRLNLQAGGSKVTVSTIHQAKGLEFSAVFVVGVEEGILPHHNSIEKGGDALEEERRLMYVAATRAMKKLVLSYCAQRSGRETKPSRFISEMNL